MGSASALINGRFTDVKELIDGAQKELDLSDAQSTAVATPAHPLGIKPAGNVYTAGHNLKSAAGDFAGLPDELIVEVLEYLDAPSLLRVEGTCKALYAFARLEELWKTLFIESSPSTFTWRSTWRSTYLVLPSPTLPPISCKGLFSDVLHRPYFCAHTTLQPYTTGIPASNAIPRLRNISVSEFSTEWTDKPFILTEPVRDWPVYQRWSTDVLCEKFGAVTFRAEAVDWPLRTYIEYMNDNSDESPLYLFDRAFVQKMDLTVSKEKGEYCVPECFGEDLFAILGEQRPDSRWLIVGPERSGSTFHKDPNATSAWNAVLRGSKYWIMFPAFQSFPPPPGVFVSEDQSEVTSPLSIVEWLLGFHAEARKTKGCVEGICGEGEVLHVPSGWWHLVVNLEPSIAITQNFVPQAHLADVIAFLRDKPAQVSGFTPDVQNPYETFLRKLQEACPETLEKALRAMEKMKEGKKRTWDELVNGDVQSGKQSEAFNFGFGDGDDVEIP